MSLLLQTVSEALRLRAAPLSGTGVMVAALCGHADTYPMQADIEGTEPLTAKPLLTLHAIAPEAARRHEHGVGLGVGVEL